MKTLIPSLPSPPPPPPAIISPPPPAIISPPLSRRLAISLSLSLSSLTFPSLSLSSPAITSKAFLDISIAGTPSGRITIGLFGQTSPAGAARFSSLVSGSAGITYRRKPFLKIAPTYIQHAGIRSYGVDADLTRHIASDELVSELSGIRMVKGTVGILVRSLAERKRATKVVARGGRIEMVEEEEEAGPNGTEFVIATKDAAELDSVALAVGRVVDGMDVVERIAGVSAVKDNTGSPYFRVAKLIGDKRAVVAERGFNRPYVKVVVTDCGLLMD